MHGFRQQLAWRPRAGAIPLGLKGWLTDPASLTARLRARCHRFDVLPLRQDLLRPDADEAGLLGLKPGRRLAWVREVVLMADDMPVVFAHSVVRAEDVPGAWRLFAGIGRRPLGEALFADPCIRRSPLALRRLDARHPLHARAAAVCGAAPTAYWARRSLFLRQHSPLLVTEVFLPDIARLAP